MTMPKFDGLADDYDAGRPRYPASLFDAIVRRLPATPAPAVLDAGAGTGIALEGLIPRLPAAARIAAVDISPDMVRLGRAKFPQVGWSIGQAEPYLEAASDLTLVVVAQALHWMDRPRFMRAAHGALHDDGLLAILQNDRDNDSSRFLDEYEGLLETHGPGYRRDYRAFDIPAELAAVFGADNVGHDSAPWSRSMGIEQFVTLCASSTRVQRAVEAHPGFLDLVRDVAARHAVDGEVTIPYRSQLFAAGR